MELHITPEQEAKLAQIAAINGTHAADLVIDAALRLLDEEARLTESPRSPHEAAARIREIQKRTSPTRKAGPSRITSTSDAARRRTW
jgi:hypothetical protein